MVSSSPSVSSRKPRPPLMSTGSARLMASLGVTASRKRSTFSTPWIGRSAACLTPPPSVMSTTSGARTSMSDCRSPVATAAMNFSVTSPCSELPTTSRGRRASTWLRARWAIWRTAAGVLSTAAAISSYGRSKTSRRTNTARSVGPSVSSTSSIAVDTLSASSTSSATSGEVSSGSGSHGPTYDSRRRDAERIRLRASRVVMRTRYARGSRTSSTSTSAHRSQVSWSTSSASAAEPSIS